jgi:hypothetical protein
VGTASPPKPNNIVTPQLATYKGGPAQTSPLCFLQLAFLFLRGPHVGCRPAMEEPWVPHPRRVFVLAARWVSADLTPLFSRTCILALFLGWGFEVTAQAGPPLTHAWETSDANLPTRHAAERRQLAKSKTRCPFHVCFSQDAVRWPIQTRELDPTHPGNLSIAFGGGNGIAVPKILAQGLNITAPAQSFTLSREAAPPSQALSLEKRLREAGYQPSGWLWVRRCGRLADRRKSRP